MTPAQLRRLAAKIGASVEDDSSGGWRVLQVAAPDGKLWLEGVKHIRVEWPDGESSRPACHAAVRRIEAQAPGYFRPIREDEKALYAED